MYANQRNNVAIWIDQMQISVQKDWNLNMEWFIWADISKKIL